MYRRTGCFAHHENLLPLIMKMLPTFLGIFGCIVIVTGASHAVCSTQPIVTEEGYDVTLQYRLDPPIDVSALTLDWKRFDPDEIIHVYRDGKDLPDEQMERYKGRTTLIHKDLKQGILTLKISSVQLNDSGQYECYILQLKTSYVMNVSVVTKDQLNTMKKGEDTITTRPPVNHDAERIRNHYFIAFPFSVIVVFIGVLVIRRRRGEEEKKNDRAKQQGNLMNEAAEEGKNPGSTVINIQHDA